MNKTISMMRGKSTPSELILEIIKSKSSFKFLKKTKGDRSLIFVILCLVHIIFILLCRGIISIEIMKQRNYQCYIGKYFNSIKRLSYL